jgi:hypothetical protein
VACHLTSLVSSERFCFVVVVVVVVFSVVY